VFACGAASRIAAAAAAAAAAATAARTASEGARTNDEDNDDDSGRLRIDSAAAFGSTELASTVRGNNKAYREPIRGGFDSRPPPSLPRS